MAKRKAPYLGKDKGCGLLGAFLSHQDAIEPGRRQWWEEHMAHHPHLVPCPKSRGWWVYREQCNFCVEAQR